MKVVTDTNVLVSALLNGHGSEAAVLFAVAERRLTWCVSPVILAEYTEVLHRPKFSRIPRLHIDAFLKLASGAALFHPRVTVKISHHVEDNRFYECAQAAEADYIITGNRRHFPKHLPPSKIVNAREMLELLEK